MGLLASIVLVASTADSTESPAYIAGTLVIPAAAVIMLIVGLVQRSKSAPKPVAPSPVPAHHGPPSGPGYPPAPGYPGPPATATTRPKRRGTGLIIAGVVLLVLWMAGNAARAGKSSSHDTELVVGDCVSASDYHNARLSTLHSTSCGDRNAVYELAAKPGPGGTCPDGKLADAGYFVLSNGTNSLCFAPNVVVGQCLRIDDHSNTITPVDCTDQSGSGTLVRVAARFDGTTDSNRCPTPAASMVTAQPRRVICLEEPS